MKTKIKVEEIRGAKGIGVWIRGGGSWYFMKDMEMEEVEVGDEVEIEYEKRVSKKGKKYNFAVRVKNLLERTKGVLQKVPSLKEATQKVKEAETEINRIVIGREDMVRMSIVNAVYGGVMLTVGPTGVGKTMTAELVSSAFSDRVFYSQFNAFKEFADVIGTLDIKKLREEGKTEYKTERFLNSDFHIYDEFYHARGKLRAALNDYILRRQLDADDRGVIRGNTRAIFLTSNKVEDLRDPKVQMEGGMAIGDRIQLVYFVEDPDAETLAQILLGDSKEYRFEKRIGGIEHLEKIRQEALKIKTPRWIVNLMGEFAGLTKAMLSEEYRPSPRKLKALLDMMKVHAVLEGRNSLEPRDFLFIAKNSLLVKDEELMKKIDELVEGLPLKTVELLKEVERIQKKELAEDFIKNNDLSIINDVEALVFTLSREKKNKNDIHTLFIKESVDIEKVEKGINLLKKQIDAMSDEDKEKLIENSVISDEEIEKQIEGMKL